jgi:hypothetical protein
MAPCQAACNSASACRPPEYRGQSRASPILNSSDEKGREPFLRDAHSDTCRFQSPPREAQRAIPFANSASGAMHLRSRALLGFGRGQAFVDVLLHQFVDPGEGLLLAPT